MSRVRFMSSIFSLRLSRSQKKASRLFGCLILVMFVIHRISHREKLAQQTKLILVYGGPGAYEPWGPRRSEASNYKFTDWDGTSCEEARCRITFDREFLPVSHAVLVHNGWGPTRNLPVEEISENRSLAQRWVLYTKECPGVLPIGKRLDGFFNWTATYRRDSDFYVPYGSYAPLKEREERSATDTSQAPSETRDQSFANDVNYASGRDKMAIFGASNHCGGQRFDLLRALMKYIDITFYGRCADHFEFENTFHCPHNLGDGCDEEIKRHKFYLAFENSLCIDYFTEKYWRNALERGLVPVVYGGASYTPDQVIPGSFINVADFDSIKALADYLKYLDKNDTAYNQYFKWKTMYKAVKPTFWLCQLCKALHDPTKPTKIYHNISYFWGVKEACRLNKDHYYELISKA